MIDRSRAELAVLLDKMEHRALALVLCALAAGAGDDELVRTTLQLLARDANNFAIRQAAAVELRERYGL